MVLACITLLKTYYGVGPDLIEALISGGLSSGALPTGQRRHYCGVGLHARSVYVCVLDTS